MSFLLPFVYVPVGVEEINQGCHNLSENYHCHPFNCVFFGPCTGQGAAGPRPEARGERAHAAGAGPGPGIRRPHPLSYVSFSTFPLGVFCLHLGGQNFWCLLTQA